MRLSDIATKLGCTLEGDGVVEISGVAGIEYAGPGQITFLSNPRYAPQLKNTRASAVILGSKVENPGVPALRSENPYLTFAQVLELFYQPPRPTIGVHPTAVLAPTANIGANASIGPYVVIGRAVTIGDRAVLHP